MIKSKEEIVNYINLCKKCFVAFQGDKKYPYIISINYKLLCNDIFIIGIEGKKEKAISKGSLNKIAVTIWNNIKGYQLKGTKRLDLREKNKNVFKNYKVSLKEEGIDIDSIKFIIYRVEEIFNVTPGESAGSKISMI